MKKIFLLIFFIPVALFAQENNERGRLELGAKVTVNDFAYLSSFDTLVKVGTFAENKVSGQIFFGLGNSQVGLFASYLSGDLLAEKYRALSFEELSGGGLFRQSLGCSEFTLGLGYYNRSQRDFGYEGMNPFDNQGRRSGLKALIGASLSQDNFNFLPKVNLRAEQNLEFGAGRGGFRNWFAKEQFGKKQYFSALAEVSLYAFHFMPEFHISPLVGVEIGQMSRLNPLIEVGGMVSSNLHRSDVLRFGYFFDPQRTGIEGFFFSLNLLRLKP